MSLTKPALHLSQGLLALAFVFIVAAGHAVEPGEEQGAPEVHAVINGELTNVAPRWMAALVNPSSTLTVSERQFCGGMLIAPTWVLTAAHCIAGRAPGDFQVLIGEANLNATRPYFHEVTEHITHPFYTSGRVNDIALLRLATPSGNPPVPLATPALDNATFNNTVQVMGWGATSFVDTAECTMEFAQPVANPADFGCKTWVYAPSKKSSVLVKTSLVMQTYEACDRRYKQLLDSWSIPYEVEAAFSAALTPEILCTWDAQEDSTPCYGDSGGPLVGTVDGVEYLFGIVGGGLVTNCLATNQIGFFSRVSYFQEFIADAMKRSLELSHEQLCPGSLAPVLSYSARADGRHDVRMTWSKDSVAEGYRVFYAPYKSMGDTMQKLELPADRTAVSTVIASDAKILVAVQARSARCDGPLSSLVVVKAP